MFGIMNEPHDIPNISTWATSVQAAVTAIRKAGATTQMCLLPGNDFTGAQTFVSNGSAGNLSRVMNLDGGITGLVFDVHKYLDSDGSGTQTECVSSHVTDTFMPLSQFLKANNRTAMLSETGGGNTTSVSAPFHTLPISCWDLKLTLGDPKVPYEFVPGIDVRQRELGCLFRLYELGSRRL